MPLRGELWSNKQLISIANSIELTIGDTGHIHSRQVWGNKDIATPFNRLYLVEAGDGVLSAGNQSFHMQPGKAYLLPADLSCSYQCNNGMHNYFFHFNVFKSDCYDLFQNLGNIGVLDLDPVFYKTLLQAYHSTSIFDAITLRQCIFHLILDFLTKYNLHQTAIQTYSQHVSSTIEYIHSHLSARLRIEDLATRLFISKNYLSALFRREVGMSIGHYIDKQLISAAQRILIQSDDSIATITSRLGYCNQFYFSKAFKKATGFSPQQYRQKTKY